MRRISISGLEDDTMLNKEKFNASKLLQIGDITVPELRRRLFKKRQEILTKNKYYVQQKVYLFFKILKSKYLPNLIFLQFTLQSTHFYIFCSLLTTPMLKNVQLYLWICQWMKGQWAQYLFNSSMKQFLSQQKTFDFYQQV